MWNIQKKCTWKILTLFVKNIKSEREVPRWPTFGPATAAIRPQKRSKKSPLQALPQPRQPQPRRQQRLQACLQSLKMEMMMASHVKVSSTNSQRAQTLQERFEKKSRFSSLKLVSSKTSWKANGTAKTTLTNSADGGATSSVWMATILRPPQFVLEIKELLKWIIWETTSLSGQTLDGADLTVLLAPWVRLTRSSVFFRLKTEACLS